MTRTKAQKTRQRKGTRPTDKTKRKKEAATLGGERKEGSPEFRPKPVRITEVTTRNLECIHTRWAESMEFFRSVFGARRTRLDAADDVVDLGPDYAVRTAGLVALIDLCTRGRKTVPQPQASHIFFWHEIVAIANEEKRLEAEGESPSKPQRPAPVISGDNEFPVAQEFAGGRICDLANAHGEKIEALIEFGLISLSGVFTARRMTLGRDGDPIDLGPDFAVGLAAQRMLMSLATRGRTPLEFPKESAGHTRPLEELMRAWDKKCEAPAVQDRDKQFDY